MNTIAIPATPAATAPLRDEDRQRCEVWTRVMGYHRPVSSFNPGKQSEHAERIPFVENSSLLEGKRACCS